MCFDETIAIYFHLLITRMELHLKTRISGHRYVDCGIYFRQLDDDDLTHVPEMRSAINYYYYTYTTDGQLK